MGRRAAELCERPTSAVDAIAVGGAVAFLVGGENPQARGQLPLAR